MSRFPNNICSVIGYSDFYFLASNASFRDDDLNWFRNKASWRPGTYANNSIVVSDNGFESWLELIYGTLLCERFSCPQFDSKTNSHICGPVQLCLDPNLSVTFSKFPMRMGCNIGRCWRLRSFCKLQGKLEQSVRLNKCHSNHVIIKHQKNWILMKEIYIYEIFIVCTQICLFKIRNFYYNWTVSFRVFHF